MASSQEQISTDFSQLRIRSRHNARDITDEFARASQGLNTGQLIKDETFTLFESVQALEIMDEKMDSGYLEPGETLQDQYDVCQELTPEQVIAIMDQHFCYEMAWQRGYPLAQNLFTSHYLDHLMSQERLQGALPYFLPSETNAQEPDQLVQLVLRAYCISVIKSCDIVIESVLSQHYYEEEDLNTNPFGREFLPDVADDQCLKLLTDALTWLENDCDIPSPLRDGLLARIQFREDFFNASFPVPPSQELNFSWTIAKNRIKRIQETHAYGKVLPAAFSPKIQRRLATTVPPRPIIEIDFGDACGDVTKFYEDLEYAFRVQLIPVPCSLDQITNLLWAFSSVKPQPSSFARAIVQRLFLSDGSVAGPGGMQRTLGAELQEQLPAEYYLNDTFWDVEVPSDPRYKIAREVDFFVEQGAPDYSNIVRSLCQNRCRIRRCLSNVVSDFDNFQESLQNRWPWLDQTARDSREITKPERHVPRKIVQVARCAKLRIMEWIVQLGFDQDLYEDYEMAEMYWYLGILSSQREQLLRQTVEELNSLTKPPAQRPPKESWQAAMYKNRDSQALKAQIISKRAALAKATADFAIGLSYVYAALRTLNLISSPPTQYTTPELQFQLRTRPFQDLRHPPAPSRASIQQPLATLRRPAPRGARGATAAHALDTARKALQPPKAALMALLKDTKPLAALAAAPDDDGALLLAEMHACTGSEDAWREDLSRALRACVRAGVAVENLSRALARWRAQGDGAEPGPVAGTELGAGAGHGTGADPGSGADGAPAAAAAAEKEGGELDADADVDLRGAVSVAIPDMDGAQRDHAWWVVPVVKDA